jgi:uncharacterized protein YcgI (DUF1989 family)
MPTIPARSSAIQHLRAGQSIKIINTSGGQVIDTWAFVPTSGFPSYMSMSHTRSTHHKLELAVGESYLDNHRNPILTITEDTSPGRHDVRYSACSPERYIQLGAPANHDNCAQNLRKVVDTYQNPSIQKLGELLEYGWIPDPLNLFMSVLVADNKIPCEDPAGKPGSYIVLKAEQECVVVMSACPMDVHICSAGAPTSAGFEVL